MKKLLTLFAFSILNSSFLITEASAQAISSESTSYSSYFLCSVPGTPKSCGSNFAGQLGDEATLNRHAPVSVSGLSDIIAMAAGEAYSLFLKDDGTVWACGRNNYGQLGDGTTTDRPTPFQVIGLSGITAIAAGRAHSLFLKDDGTIWACGRNDYGQFGNGEFDNSSTPIQTCWQLTDITAIAAGELHSLFLRNDATVWAAGDNHYGQLGNGVSSPIISASPNLVDVFGIIAIAAGSNHSLFLKDNFKVWACGRNTLGQLGDGTTDSRYTPIEISALGSILAMAAGDNHSLFLTVDNTAMACGENFYGKLGNGTTTNSSTPVTVNGPSGISAIAAGKEHSLFLTDDGSFWACGMNSYGQVGDGTGIDKLVPVQIMSNGECSNVGIEETDGRYSGLSVYPNPATNNITVQTTAQGQRFTMKIYNAVGQQVFQRSNMQQSSTIDISSLSAGIYHISLFEGEQQRQGKFVKE